jgi:hypothetical protein
MRTRRSSRTRPSRSTPARDATGHADRPLLGAAALIALVFAVFHAVRRFPFIGLDDPVSVTANPTVEAGLSWATAWWALTTGHAPYWHPVTWLSHFEAERDADHALAIDPSSEPARRLLASLGKEHPPA